MNPDSSFDDRVAAWFADEAPTQIPDRVVHATLERTRRTRQAWTLPGRRQGIMNLRMVGIGAAAVAVIAVVIFGAGLLRPIVGPGAPTASPVSSSVTSPSAPGTGSPPSAAPAPTSGIPPVTGLTGRIAFARSSLGGLSDIWVMRPDRTDLRQLTTGAGSNRQPAWSPDGSRIAFTSDRDGEPGIWVMNADGSNQERVTPAGLDVVGEASWSPGGTVIAFSRGELAPGGEDEGVYTINVDGSNLTPILLSGDQGMPLAATPIWSPDGSAMLIRGETDLFLIGMEGLGAPPRNLTNTPSTEDAAGSWSANGNWIAYQGDAGGGCLYKIKPDGSESQRLTSGCSQGISMSWSPDGSHLAWAGGAHGAADLFVVDADGSNRRQLTDTRDITEISWGP